MSYQEKRSIASIVSTLLSFIIYYYYVYQMYQEADTTTFDEFSFWAAVILLLIPVQVVFKVVVYIVFVIINTIATRREEYEISTDEFDKVIEQKSTRRFYNVFMTGFLVAMGALVLHYEPVVMFNIILFTLIIAAVFMDAAQIYFYRRGV